MRLLHADPALLVASWLDCWHEVVGELGSVSPIMMLMYNDVVSMVYVTSMIKSTSNVRQVGTGWKKWYINK